MFEIVIEGWNTSRIGFPVDCCTQMYSCEVKKSSAIVESDISDWECIYLHCKLERTLMVPQRIQTAEIRGCQKQ